jgi:hypothetical protein
MQEYNNGISSTLMRNVYKGVLDGTNQPTMLGGRRVTRHPLAGANNYSYPSSLAVRTAGSSLRGGKSSFWKDFGHGFKQGLVGTAQVVAPIAGEVAKDVALSYLKGGKKYTFGNFLKDAGDVAHPFVKELAPVAKDVATSVAKEAIKSYLKGGAMLKNNPAEYQSDHYPPALASYYPDESHMFGGDMKHYWNFIKAEQKRNPHTTIPEIRARLKMLKQAKIDSGYTPSEPKKRSKKTKESKKKMSASAVKKIFGPTKKKMSASAVKKMFGSGLDYDSESDEEDEIGGKRNVLDDITKVSKAVAPYAVPLMMMGLGRKKKTEMSLPKSAHKRYSVRGDIVAEIMKKQGLSLGQASKFVKDNGLY